MSTVVAHLFEEAMKHFINSHQQNEIKKYNQEITMCSQPVHIDGNNLPLNIQDDTGNRGVAVLNPTSFSTQLCRQVGDNVHAADSNTWGEEILDADGKLAALVAHLSQNPRSSHLQHKAPPTRTDVDASVISDATLRLFNGQTLDQPSEHMTVPMPSLPPLPQLQEMKQRCQEGWFAQKQIKRNLVKEDSSIMNEVDQQALEMAGASPAQNKQSKKSLPHKKRISRKLKRNTGCSTPQGDIVMINCSAERPSGEEILPDNFMASAPHQDHIPDPVQHITHVRPILICQICGEFYGEDQLKFYHHLKHHYESQTIIIENPVPDLGIDKMTNTCIVDDVPTLPDSLVELSLENSLATKSTIYQPIDKHVLYTTAEKSINYANNKGLYSMASIDKPHPMQAEPPKELYDPIAKQELYNCTKCNKSFKKQIHCELHIKKAHNHNKSVHEMNEFSEPEDLMEGIYVMVVDEENAESGNSSNYADHFLPHLTVDNGHVHQEHAKHWYGRSNGQNSECNAEDGYCAVCAAVRDNASPQQHLQHLKEEVLQRIFEVEVNTSENQNFTENMNIPESANIQQDTEDSQHAEIVKVPDEDRPSEELSPGDELTNTGEEISNSVTEVNEDDDKKKQRKFSCPHCPRVLNHRNSLLYHLLSHAERRAHKCEECGKAFYTAGALKIHSRMHNGEKPYKCSECGRDFRQWGDLKYHVGSLHSKQKQYKCEYCSKEFARKYSLTLHRRIHTGERNYKCHYCNKSFRASCYRLSHMRTHTGEKPHKCEECGKSFRAGGDLRRHMLMHEKARARRAHDKEAVKTECDRDSPPRDGDTDPDTDGSCPRDPLDTRKRPKMSTKSTAAKNNCTSAKKLNKTKSRKTDKSTPNVTVTKGKTNENDSSTIVSEQFEGMKIGYAGNQIVANRHDKARDRPATGQHKLKNNRVADERGSEDFVKSEIDLQREYTTLRPPYGTSACETDDVKNFDRLENTDGKSISVYTLVEKPKEFNGPPVPNQSHVGDVRTASDGRHRPEHVQHEPIESVFIERLTDLYNIAHV